MLLMPVQWAHCEERERERETIDELLIELLPTLGKQYCPMSTYSMSLLFAVWSDWFSLNLTMRLTMSALFNVACSIVAVNWFHGNRSRTATESAWRWNWNCFCKHALPIHSKWWNQKSFRSLDLFSIQWMGSLNSSSDFIETLACPVSLSHP